MQKSWAILFFGNMLKAYRATGNESRSKIRTYTVAKLTQEEKLFCKPAS